MLPVIPVFNAALYSWRNNHKRFRSLNCDMDFRCHSLGLPVFTLKKKDYVHFLLVPKIVCLCILSSCHGFGVSVNLHVLPYNNRTGWVGRDFSRSSRPTPTLVILFLCPVENQNLCVF